MTVKWVRERAGRYHAMLAEQKVAKAWRAASGYWYYWAAGTAGWSSRLDESKLLAERELRKVGVLR